MSSEFIGVGLGIMFCLSTVCLIVRIEEVRDLKQYVKFLEKELKISKANKV